MGWPFNRRVVIWLAVWAGLAGAAALALAGAALLMGMRLPPLRQPFPGALPVSERRQIAWPRGLTATRQYVALAPHRDVVEWYRGKDSLTPLPRVMWTHCSQHGFQQRQSALGRFLKSSRIEETITICPTAGGVAVTSVTTYYFPSFRRP